MTSAVQTPMFDAATMPVVSAKFKPTRTNGPGAGAGVCVLMSTEP